MAKQAKVAVPATAPAYVLGDKATAIVAAAPRVTAQRLAQVTTPKVAGHWAKVNGTSGSNTRAAALAAIAAVAPCSAESAAAALKASGVHLGSGTPRSYVVAFIKNGYLVVA
jgi:hypothetical protein